MPTHIVVVRHGQTEWNRVERFRGRADIGLNETGEKQAEATAARLAGMGVSAIYSSPLRRAMRTAQPAATLIGIAPAIAPELLDVDYGEWQGLTLEEAEKRYPETFETWRRTPQATRFPGGESMEEVRLRASRFIDSITSEHPEQTIAMVSHIVVCRMIILHFLGIDLHHFWKLGLNNCSLSIFNIRDTGPVAMGINDTCHLQPTGAVVPEVTASWVTKTLKMAYGVIPLKPVLDPVDELIQTVLSQNTSDVNSGRAYAELKSRFPTWQKVLRTTESEIAEAIQSGGLANVKAPRIQAILSKIVGRRGNMDLRFLPTLPLKEAKAWLQELPGVGAKTAACVLLFSLGMPALPVDTHVLRLAKRLGLVSQATSAEKAEDILEGFVPPEKVYSFHLLLIRHGRLICKSQRPLCGQCVLNERCPSAFAFA